MKSKKKYSICKSQYPKGEKTHIVISELFSDHGCCCGKVFQGTLEECKQRIKELRGKQNAK